MQNSKNSGEPERFDFLLFEKFSNHCLANTVEPLRAANTLARKCLYEWRFLTIDGRSVSSSSGLQVHPQAAVRDESGALLVVMPSYGFREVDGWEISRILRAASKRYDRMAGLDTGSWLMARAGLLDGYEATIHWEEFDSFSEVFPDVISLRERHIIDRDRITCSGAMAAFELFLRIIREAHGPMLALEIAQLFMTPGSTRSHGVGMYQHRGLGRTLDRIIALMADNIEDPLSIAEIAKRLGVGQKSLEMRVRAEYGQTPQMLYKRLRLNHARKLVVETDLGIAEISMRCGYQNASAMTRAFKSVFNTTPNALRR